MRVGGGGARTFKTRAFYPWCTGDKREAKPEERPVMKWHTLPACHSAAAAAPPPPPPPHVTDNTTGGMRQRRPEQFAARRGVHVVETFLHFFSTPGDRDGDKPAQIKNRPQSDQLGWETTKRLSARFEEKRSVFFRNHHVAARHRHCSSFYFVEKKKIKLVTACYTTGGMEGQTKPT